MKIAIFSINIILMKNFRCVREIQHGKHYFGEDKGSRMNIPQYLRRIQYDGSTSPSERTLSMLHIAHQRHVPFENLDIHLGRKIILDEELLFDKIVLSHRGGFCYELNGLFSELLRALGFTVTMLSARVVREGGGFGPEFDHLTLLVEQEKRWLVDVGFGDSFQTPLLLDSRSEQSDGSARYRISALDGALLLERNSNDVWKAQYTFTLVPHSLAEYSEMCEYHQTSPDSHFTKQRLCTLPTGDGRVTLSGESFITTLDGQKTEVPIRSEAEYVAILKKYFGIQL